MSNEQLGARVATLYELQSAWLEPKLLEYGIRWITFQLLATIIGAGDLASQAEVARRLGVAPATLSESVAHHVEDGFIQQVPSKKDKRVKVLKLTPQAKRVMTKVTKLIQDCEASMCAGVKEREAKIVARTLDQMIENLEKDLKS